MRPAWLSDEYEVDYETTERNEPFKGTEASLLLSSSAFVNQRLFTQNLGINKPNTNGDKPSFY
ncbi:Rossmann-fold NAD(P)-binding domain-containing protein [Edaphobacter flagellatus]|uniref:hypothetical protein n=1 Tax=Edaphobacter flagellatus TaxID=1933044 RepID=UPI0036F3B05E